MQFDLGNVSYLHYISQLSDKTSDSDSLNASYVLFVVSEGLVQSVSHAGPSFVRGCCEGRVHAPS